MRNGEQGNVGPWGGSLERAELGAGGYPGRANLPKAPSRPRGWDGVVFHVVEHAPAYGASRCCCGGAQRLFPTNVKPCHAAVNVRGGWFPRIHFRRTGTNHGPPAPFSSPPSAVAARPWLGCGGVGECGTADRMCSEAALPPSTRPDPSAWRAYRQLAGNAARIGPARYLRSGRNGLRITGAGYSAHCEAFRTSAKESVSEFQ